MPVKISAIKPLPGKKKDFPNVRSRVNSFRVARPSATNEIVSPSVTSSTTVVGNTAFRSRIPVRRATALVSQAILPLAHHLAQRHSKIPVRLNHLGDAAHSHLVPDERIDLASADDELQVVLMLDPEEEDDLWKFQIMEQSILAGLTDLPAFVLDPIEEAALRAFELLENTIVQEELEQRSPTAPMITSLRFNIRQRFTPELDTIPEVDEDRRRKIQRNKALLARRAKKRKALNEAKKALQEV
ncbi:hypothetical protein GHT06_016086 [Daphnia sinensis]|uniref:Uncharacterized protein n=1 Tax=Daphnia sinensis TaxID=1820382 RepID=A0AAD5KUF3_9CRUS|nr:hypothetical protein GHT06_016086 [Daphnia sinensis]